MVTITSGPHNFQKLNRQSEPDRDTEPDPMRVLDARVAALDFYVRVRREGGRGGAVAFGGLARGK